MEITVNYAVSHPAKYSIFIHNPVDAEIMYKSGYQSINL
jgi:hypothetical protein